MRNSFLLCLLVFLTFQLEAQIEKETTAFIHANVLTMTNNAVLNDYTVIVKNGKIQQMGPSAKLEPSKKATVIDCQGKYLLPGLTEMHAHIPTPEKGDDSYAKEVLMLYLSCGVTTIRGMLGDPYHLGLRQQAADNLVLSPRIFTATPSFSGGSVATPDEARQKVLVYKQQGYDFLKIHPGVKLAVFDEMAKTADKVGIRFSGHVPAEVGIRHALAAKYASIDHIDGYLEGLVPEEWKKQNPDGGFFGMNYVPKMDEKEIPALVAETKKQGVWIVPTQSLFLRWFSPADGNALANEPEMQYMPSKTLYQWRQSKQQLTGNNFSADQWKIYIDLRNKFLRAMEQAGVGLLLGSDAPQVFNVPGFSLRHEMKGLQEAGLSNFTILQSGTANPARFFGKTGEFGTIEKAASADLILLDGNPLEDLSNTWRQSGVMVRGKWLSKAFIAAELAKIAEKRKS